MSEVGNNLSGDYRMELDEPDPCNMEQVRNDVQHASRWNRAHRAIEILCGRNEDHETRITNIENNSGSGDGCPDYCGNGSPEGVVTAAIGSSYMQNDAASTSHSRWVKFSNAGNTGWRQWNGLRGGAGANTALRLGDNSVASGTDSIAFGENSTASGLRSIAIGKSSVSTGQDSISMGRSNTTNAQSIVIGILNTLEADSGIHLFNDFGGQVVVGHKNVIQSNDPNAGDTDRAIIIGNDNYMSTDGDSSIMIGTANDNIDCDHVHMIGHNNAASIGVGMFSSSFGVMIGDSILAAADCFVALGYASAAFGVGAHALGTHSQAGVDGAVSEGCITIGRFSASLGDNSICIGADAEVTALAPRSIGIGQGSSVTAAESIALGTNATNAVANTMVIGSATEPIDTITVITSTGTKTVTLV